MKRFWLLPLAALSLAGAVSAAQAAPGSPLLATIKIAGSDTAVQAQQIHWRRHHHHRRHHHRHHHHRHHHHR